MVNENGKYENLSDGLLNNSCRNLYSNTSEEKIKVILNESKLYTY